MSGKGNVDFSMTRICSDLTVIHPKPEVKEQKYTSGAAVGLTMFVNNYG